MGLHLGACQSYVLMTRARNWSNAARYLNFPDAAAGGKCNKDLDDLSRDLRHQTFGSIAELFAAGRILQEVGAPPLQAPFLR